MDDGDAETGITGGGAQTNSVTMIQAESHQLDSGASLTANGALPADAPTAAAASPLWVRFRAWGRSFMSTYSLFFVSFFTVLREGLESVVFLFGVGNASPESIPISGIIGILCGLSVGVIIYFSGKQVSGVNAWMGRREQLSGAGGLSLSAPLRRGRWVPARLAAGLGCERGGLPPC